MSKENIYKFKGDFYYAVIEGIFVANEDAMKFILNKEIQFGEIAGKHSDLNWILDEDEITLISSDKDLVNLFKDNNFATGINPFDYPILLDDNLFFVNKFDGTLTEDE